MSAVVLQDGVRIPDGIDSLEAFRQWARSDEFPERGRFAYLHGEIWVDLSMEQAFTHNQVKVEVSDVVRPFVKTEKRGYYFTDGMLLTLPDLNFATVPDGMFISFGAVRAGRIRLEAGTAGGCVEVIGAPEMALEVVSDHSVQKDTEELLVVYWQAGVLEYWLVDARSPNISFDIFNRGRRGFTAGRRQAGGWLRSTVFGQAFRIVTRPDSLGNPECTLEMRPL